MTLEKHSTEIREQGFSIVPDILGPGQVEELKAALPVVVEKDWEKYGGLPGKNENLVLDLMQYGGPFARLLDNEKMHDVFSRILGDACILYSFTSTFLRPGDSPGPCLIHVDAPRIILGYDSGLLMTLALDDFTEENGATYYLPGSQERPDAPSSEEFHAGAVRVCRKAGDAVAFNPRCWHRGGENTTGDVRHAVTVYACRSFMRQRFDFPRMVSPDVLSELGERGRAFLGFDVRVPTNCEEFYVPPERRLYKAGQG